MTNMPGTHVLVAGFGVSGEAVTRWLIRDGVHVTVVDADPGVAPTVEASGAAFDPAADPANFDFVVASPGIPPHTRALADALAAGVPVWSEVEFASRNTTVPIIGITGTNGKTTTTEMLTSILVASGRRAIAAGNIGMPLIEAIEDEPEVIVAELSSFQLWFTDTFRPTVAVLLNVADDHLDWHGSFDAYVAAKTKMFSRQEPEDVAVHLDEEICARSARAGRGRPVAFSGEMCPPGGAGVEGGAIVTPEGRVVTLAELRIDSAPMIANAVAAAAGATALGIAPAIVGEALARFEPGAHRTERIATSSGITYVNDSKATNPHATLAALHGSHDVVLIAGGRNKDLDLRVLARGADAVKAVVAIGETADAIAEAFVGRPVRRATSMDEAVEIARSLAHAGDTVLLSPACASFDMFTGYQARGEAFRSAVHKIVEGEGEDR